MIYRQRVITRHSTELYCNYTNNYLSWNSVYPYSRMVIYHLLLFMLKIETSTGGTNSMPFLVFRRDHLRSTSGIICSSGSFAVQFGDHFRPGDHLRSGIICDAVQYSLPLSLGDAVSKLKMFLWILNHISRSITWSLFILKSSYLVK